MSQVIETARKTSTHARAGAPRLAGSWLSRMAVAVALANALACTTLPTPQPPTQYPDYRVGAPDELTVTILPEPVIREELVVRPDGKITVQLVGDVQAGGRTLDEIAADVEKRIARFKRGATVTVQLTTAASASVTVLGEVRNQSTFALTRQMRVAEALGVVGGTTFLANEDSVRVVRAGDPTEVLMVDLEAIRDGDLRTNIQLYGGDVVYVPPTLWAEVGYFVQAVIFPLNPLLGVANAAGGAALVK